MKYLKLPLLLVSIFVISGCTNNDNSSSSDSSSSDVISTTTTTSSGITTSEQLGIIDTLNAIEDKISLLVSDFNKVSYQTAQLDNYYGIDIEIYQSGEITVYDDYFYQDLFSQQIGDYSPYNGITERGIYNSYVYEITEFEDGEENNQSVFYLQADDSDFLNYYFSIDFATLYITDVIEASYNTYIGASGYNTTITTNILDLDLSSDDEYTLEYDIEFKSGTMVVFEFYRQDVINISDGQVVSSTSDYYQSYSDAINYNSVHTERTYSSVSSSYEGSKIDPSKYL